MAKLVGFRYGMPVQAAAGDWKAEVNTPAGAMLTVSAIVAGAAFGTVVGSTLKGGRGLLDTDPVPKRDLSDFEEFVGLGAFGAGLLVSVHVMKQIVKDYGWNTMGWYTAGVGGLYLLMKAIRK